MRERARPSWTVWVHGEVERRVCKAKWVPVISGVAFIVLPIACMSFMFAVGKTSSDGCRATRHRMYEWLRIPHEQVVPDCTLWKSFPLISHAAILDPTLYMFYPASIIFTILFIANEAVLDVSAANLVEEVCRVVTGQTISSIEAGEGSEQGAVGVDEVYVNEVGSAARSALDWLECTYRWMVRLRQVVLVSLVVANLCPLNVDSFIHWVFGIAFFLAGSLRGWFNLACLHFAHAAISRAAGKEMNFAESLGSSRAAAYHTTAFIFVVQIIGVACVLSLTACSLGGIVPFYYMDIIATYEWYTHICMSLGLSQGYDDPKI